MRSTIHPPLRLGSSVHGADGEKIGDIAAIENDHLVIEKGFIFTQDLCVPLSAVAAVGEDGRVSLFLTKDEVTAEDWSAPPVFQVDYGARATRAAVDAAPAEYVDPAVKVIERSREQKRSRRAASV